MTNFNGITACSAEDRIIRVKAFLNGDNPEEFSMTFYRVSVPGEGRDLHQAFCDGLGLPELRLPDDDNCEAIARVAQSAGGSLLRQVIDLSRPPYGVKNPSDQLFINYFSKRFN